MSAPTMIRTAEGVEIDPSGMICEDCGEPIGSHGCKNSPAPVAAPVTTRSYGPRKDPKARPLCPHCAGPVHFSMPGLLQNVECLTRQYCVDKGIMSDPFQRIPVGGLEILNDVVTWAGTLATKPTYGRMESAAGGAGTYASLRPKTGRKKKAVAAGEGEKIEDMAAKVAIEAPATKSKKSRKGKAESRVADNQAIAASLDAADALEEAEEIVKPKRSGKDKTETPVEIAQKVEPININGAAEERQPTEQTESPEDKKARRTAERAARRQAILGKA
jgi:hypothetical protein